VLWERIMASEEWWKSTMWTRLVHRELPDIWLESQINWQ
jgi:hypothetical protein